MEEEYTPIETQLKNAIKESLQNHITSNAVFLAERLLAERDSETNRNLLAECYLAENKAYKVYYILKDCKSDQNRYKFALACLKLNKLKEAEKALVPELFNKNFIFHQRGSIESVPNGAHGFYLLGLICERQQKFSESKDYYQKALNQCPILWSAYEKLCKMGEINLQPNMVFNEAQFKSYEQQKLQTQKFQSYNKSTPNQLDQQQFEEEVAHNKGRPIVSLKSNPFPGSGMSQNHDDISVGSGQKKGHFISSQGQQYGSINSRGQIQLSNAKKKQSMDQTEQMQQINIPRNQFQQNLSLQKIFLEQTIPIKDIMTLLRRLAEPLFQMSQYKCSEAIDLYNKLPTNHFNTGWVLGSIGRCYMEIVKYQDAERHYSESFKLEPYRLEGIELYSSCLWHLKKQVELCHLAHQALEKSTLAFETWIAVGNCFSLQKEHENSLKFFNRAIQLNSHQPYGHNLCGCEYMFNEDFQKARKCFENALNLDIRHYNAWWGLGNIYFKQEKYEKAVEHFMKAITINQRNPVLYSFMGMTLAAKRDYVEALKYFQSSEVLDENNGLNRFQKANTLVKLEKYKDALEELDKLYRMMPKESPIPIMMGRIYKKLNKIPEAQKYFEIALDLEHKDPQRIKALIESLHNNNNEFSEDLDM